MHLTKSHEVLAFPNLCTQRNGPRGNSLRSASHAGRFLQVLGSSFPLTISCSSGRQSSQYALGQTSQRKSSPPAAEVLRPHWQHLWCGQAHLVTEDMTLWLLWTHSG